VALSCLDTLWQEVSSRAIYVSDAVGTVFETGLECLIKVAELLLIGLLGSTHGPGPLPKIPYSWTRPTRGYYPDYLMIPRG
jgi:hypothetical protein